MRICVTPLQDVAVGAILGEDLSDSAGRVLLPRGTRLDDSSLAGLRRRGIESVAIEVIEASDAEQLAARRIVVEQELRLRFRRAGSGSAAQLLLRAALEHLLEKTC